MDFVGIFSSSLQDAGLIARRAKVINGTPVHAVPAESVVYGDPSFDKLEFMCAECEEPLKWGSFSRLGRIRRSSLGWELISGCCTDCARIKHSQLRRTSPLYTAELKVFAAKNINSMKGRTSIIARALSITQDDLINLYLQQEGKCALTGVTMNLNRVVGRENNFKASVDRIDSRFGYIACNIQWLCWAVNKMKQTLSQREFITWCSAVAALQSRKEEDLLSAIAL